MSSSRRTTSAASTSWSPPGSGGGQAKSLGTEGKDTVAAHLAKGRGVIGICAGAYLLLKGGGLPLVDGVEESGPEELLHLAARWSARRDKR